VTFAGGLDFDGACQAAPVCPTAPVATVSCDGPEDCASTEACCIVISGFSDNTISCVEASLCGVEPLGGAPVCVTSDDCGPSEVCCAFDDYKLPVDMGVCQPASEGCQVSPT
jgi:hypothetical protein